MKPKTQEKLTKHTNPRWLMGQEKWPVDQYHRQSHVWCALSHTDLHLLDITPRNVCFSNTCNRWVVLWQHSMRPVMSLNDTFPCVFFLSIRAVLKMGGYQCGNDVRQAMTTCSLLHDATLMSLALRTWTYGERIFNLLSNYHCNSLIALFHPDATRRLKKKTLEKKICAQGAKPGRKFGVSEVRGWMSW